MFSKEKGRKLEAVELKRFVPAPGIYSPKINIGESIVASNYTNFGPKSFYHHDRFPDKTVKTLRCKRNITYQYRDTWSRLL